MWVKLVQIRGEAEYIIYLLQMRLNLCRWGVPQHAGEVKLVKMRSGVQYIHFNKAGEQNTVATTFIANDLFVMQTVQMLSHACNLHR